MFQLGTKRKVIMMNDAFRSLFLEKIELDIDTVYAYRDSISTPVM
jgi:hypothetical protein